MQDEPTTLPYATLETEALLECVAAHGWAVIEGMPCRAGNAPLLELANSLGSVNPLCASDEARDVDGVHLVTYMPRPVIDATGKPMLSNTATDFPLHTDECFARVPSQYVLLHCWNEDAGGNGDSLLASSDAIAARLEPWALDLCHRAHFVWRSCRAPIFSRRPDLDWPLVRFNIREISGDDLSDEADLRARALPDLFLAAAHAAAEQVLLESGDCLVIDNRRVLHGRVAFDPASKRLLKRVWVRAAEAAAPQDAANAKKASTAAAG